MTFLQRKRLSVTTARSSPNLYYPFSLGLSTTTIIAIASSASSFGIIILLAIVIAMCARTKKKRRLFCRRNSYSVLPPPYTPREPTTVSLQPSEIPPPGDCVPVHLGQPNEGESAAEAHPQRRVSDDVQNDVSQVA